MNFNFLKQSVLQEKSTKEIIEEIHETFYTEVDRILAEANIYVSEQPKDANLLEKSNRLKKLGFSATKEVTISKQQESIIEEARKENEVKDHLKRAVNYFSFKYPQYKFITEDSVKNICDKYGLVYGEVSRYKGTVPEENLEQMENFKIEDVDVCAKKESVYLGFMPSGYTSPIDYFSKNELRSKKIEDDKEGKSSFMSDFRTFFRVCPLEIAAPVKDFDMEGHKLEGNKIVREIPDPVVLQPVHFEGKKHYLIVTAWGEEASDELVVNERLN